MRQTFDVKGGPQTGRDNLPKLRSALADANLDGFYVPHEDEYQNEYLPACNERLEWMSGFTGSAGSALVLQNRAILFVDGRYTLQAKDQVDTSLFDIVDFHDPGPFKWIAKQTLEGHTIGYDPALMTPVSVEEFKKCIKKAGGSTQSLSSNPIDAAWSNRPAAPAAPVVPHEKSFTGESSADKRTRLAATLADDKLDGAVITAPASIAWLFNVRGGDVDYSPLPLGRAVLKKDGRAELYLATEKVSDELRDHLGNEVALLNIDDLEKGLRGLSGQKISLDPNLASQWFFDTLEAAGSTIVKADDPCVLPKAIKNAAEIAGTERAHQRDGVAIIRFLHWLDTEAQSGNITEIESVEKLEHLREETGGLKDLSFDTISGAGPNGAIVHYRVSSATNRKLEKGSLYLVDSGGQYLDGTTDITRTVPIGEPTSEMCDRYTRVLKGHIAMAEVIFPDSTTGTHLDAMARQFLWKVGLDYGHGTGHGVGSYLGVHEGPQRIARAWNSVALKPGMIVSNEPGYYKAHEYGIRIENLQYVVEKDFPDAERPFYGFEQVTLAPLSRKLIVRSLLTPEETKWVDEYHARVWRELSPRLQDMPEVYNWLEDACQLL